MSISHALCGGSSFRNSLFALEQIHGRVHTDFETRRGAVDKNQELKQLMADIIIFINCSIKVGEVKDSPLKSVVADYESRLNNFIADLGRGIPVTALLRSARGICSDIGVLNAQKHHINDFPINGSCDYESIKDGIRRIWNLR